jgi:hypothetical protein
LTHPNKAHLRRTRPETERTHRIRASERVRRAVLTGKLVRPEHCTRCQRADCKILSYIPDLMNPLDNVEWLCSWCHKEAVPRKPTVQPKRMQAKKKLPPYAELKKLVMPPRMGGKGWTYAEVAAKYKCSKVVVGRTLRDRALAHGDPWPIFTHDDRIAKVIRGERNNPRTLPSNVLWSLVEEYLDANEMSVREFCRRNAFTYGWAISVKTGRYPRISKTYFVALCDAINEPVPAWLRQEVDERFVPRRAA